MSPEEKRARQRIANKKYYASHREEQKARALKYRADNPEKCAAYLKRYWRSVKGRANNAKHCAKYQAEHSEELRAYRARYRAANRDKLNAYDAARRIKNSVKIKQYQAAYRIKNRAKLNVYKAKHSRHRRSIDPHFRLIQSLRCRMHHALKAKSAVKAARSLDLFGCTTSELRTHLEHQFTPEMNWLNRGTYWHVDHIKPCAKFDLRDPEQQRVCFHFTNLRPLYWRDNLKKGAR